MTEWESWDNTKGWTKANFAVKVSGGRRDAIIPRQVSVKSNTSTQTAWTIHFESPSLSRKESLSVNEVFEEVTQIQDSTSDSIR